MADVTGAMISQGLAGLSQSLVQGMGLVQQQQLINMKKDAIAQERAYKLEQASLVRGALGAMMIKKIPVGTTLDKQANQLIYRNYMQGREGMDGINIEKGRRTENGLELHITRDGLPAEAPILIDNATMDQAINASFLGMDTSSLNTLANAKHLFEGGKKTDDDKVLIPKRISMINQSVDILNKQIEANGNAITDEAELAAKNKPLIEKAALLSKEAMRLSDRYANFTGGTEVAAPVATEPAKAEPSAKAVLMEYAPVWDALEGDEAKAVKKAAFKLMSSKDVSAEERELAKKIYKNPGGGFGGNTSLKKLNELWDKSGEESGADKQESTAASEKKSGADYAVGETVVRNGITWKKRKDGKWESQ